MNKWFTFNTAVLLVVVMGGIAFINTAGDAQDQPRWTPAFGGMLLVYLVLASIVPVIMVPVGMVIVLWQVLHSVGLGSWIANLGKGPEGKILRPGKDNGVVSPSDGSGSGSW